MSAEFPKEMRTHTFINRGESGADGRPVREYLYAVQHGPDEYWTYHKRNRGDGEGYITLFNSRLTSCGSAAMRSETLSLGFEEVLKNFRNYEADMVRAGRVIAPRTSFVKAAVTGEAARVLVNILLGEKGAYGVAEDARAPHYSRFEDVRGLRCGVTEAAADAASAPAPNAGLA